MRALALVLALLVLSGCARSSVREPDECTLGSHCDGEVHVRCDGATLRRDCAAEGLLCEPALGCVRCLPGEIACRGESVARCADDASGWEIVEGCDLRAGTACREGTCADLCALASFRPTHAGCEHWAVDLDNVDTLAPDGLLLPFGVFVANPWPAPARVRVEANEAELGAPPRIVTIEERLVPPFDHDVIELPRRPVDGSYGGAPPTHSALGPHAYRIESRLPVIVVQASPLGSEGGSGGSSLLVPAATLGERTTVVSWPQTIADGDDPSVDFDPSRDDEDMRAFLTIVGVSDATDVRITLGPLLSPPAEVVAGGPVPRLVSGDSFEIALDRFDVLNLETRGLNADFTGTRVESSAPVAVFSGSEASDVPRFDSYGERRCCADHMEEQLLPDRYAGRHFVIGRQHPRRPALARARGLGAPEVDEPEWVRIVAVADSELASDLAAVPRFLRAGESALVRADRSFELRVTSAEGSLHVLSALASQDALGIDTRMPGGDPSLTIVPPVEAFSRATELVVREGSYFDFVTVLAPLGALVTLDGARLEDRSAPDGSPACRVETASASFVVYQCQLGFPRIDEELLVIDEGEQDDGLHVLLSDEPIGVTVSGFHDYIGYAYPGAFAAFTR